MDAIFINSKTPQPHVLILKVTNKLDLRIGEKVIALWNLSIYCTWEKIKSSYNNNKSKILHQHGMKNLNYQINLILYQIFKIILSIFKKTWRRYSQTINTNICK